MFFENNFSEHLFFLTFPDGYFCEEKRTLRAQKNIQSMDICDMFWLEKDVLKLWKITLVQFKQNALNFQTKWQQFQLQQTLFQKCQENVYGIVLL